MAIHSFHNSATEAMLEQYHLTPIHPGEVLQIDAALDKV